MVTSHKTVFSAHLEAYVPLWPGGPLNASTYKCIGRRCVGPFLPDAKQLIGKMRWLLRTAEASVRIMLGERPGSYREVETLASRLFGHTGMASKIRVRLIFEGADNSMDYLPLNTAIRLDEHLSKSRERCVDIALFLEVKGFSIMRRRLGLDPTPRLVGKSIERYQRCRRLLGRLEASVPEDFYRMAAIPRVRLALQGKKRFTEIYEAQPIKPGQRIKVELSTRPGVEADTEETALAVLSTLFTLGFLGLGKASSRGFGRFKLLRNGVEVLGEDLESSIGDLARSYEKLLEAGKAFGTFRESCIRLVELASRLLGAPLGDAEDLMGSVDFRNTAIPSLAIALKYSRVINNLKHPCPYATQELVENGLPGCGPGARKVGDVIDALSAVGKATLKSTWKYIQRGTQGLRGAGVGYHTWPLGLPRSVKQTGYHLARNTFADEGCNTSLKDLGLMLEEDARRLSPISVSVACSDGSCFALLEPFLTYTDFSKHQGRLVHIGKHEKHVRGRRVWVFHVVNTAYAAKRNKLGQGGCPQDRSGVARPLRDLGPASDPIGEPIEAALEWLKYLLGESHGHMW